MVLHPWQLRVQAEVRQDPLEGEHVLVHQPAQVRSEVTDHVLQGAAKRVAGQVAALLQHRAKQGLDALGDVCAWVGLRADRISTAIEGNDPCEGPVFNT